VFDENQKNSKHQKPNLKQIPMTKFLNPKQIIGLILRPMYNHLLTSVFEAMQSNGGECFGH
jgi:hypothetical protein